MERQRDGATIGKSILWSGVELEEAVNGRWITDCPHTEGATGVCYMANQVIEGDIVFTVDPNKWGARYRDTTNQIPKLFASGAAAVITDKLGSDLSLRFPILLVRNTREALDDLGKAARDRFNGKVICVTGSVGKSSTKEGLRHVLSQQAPTVGSRRNFNHGPGVPLSLAQTPRDYSYGVYEFAVDLPRITLRKAKIARPHVVIVTHIQPDHLLYYPSLEAIADQKSLLFDGMAPDGAVVLNRDAPQFERLMNNAKRKGIKRVLTFGETIDADIRLVTCELHEDLSYVCASVNGKKLDYVVGVPGRHMVINSLAILAGVEAVGADSGKAAMALASLQPLPNHTIRHQIKIDDGLLDIIDDTFSSNSGSIKAALEYLQLIKPGPNGRRLVILGEIKGLGEMSQQVHAELASPVLANDIEKVFTIGDGMLSLRARLPAHKLAFHAKTFSELIDAVVEEVRAGDVVLVKGSRHAVDDMGKVIDALKHAASVPREKTTIVQNSMAVLKDIAASMAKGTELSMEEKQDRSIHPVDSRLPVVSIPARKQDKNRMEILFVGDTYFGESYQTGNEKNGCGHILRDKGYDYPLKNMRRILRQADAVVANLETPLTDLASSLFEGNKGYVQWSDIQQTPEQLLKHNIMMVSLANNHTLDYGQRGLEQTLEALQRSGIRHFGAGRSAADARGPLMVEVHVAGRPFRMAVLGVFEYRKSYQDKYDWYAQDDRAGVAALDDRTLRLIRELKQSDPSLLVVVFPHWGQSYQPKTAHQVEMAYAMLEAGADLILGHGAHALQEIEYRQGRWVIYGMGNFMFNSPGRYSKTGAPPYGLVVKLVVSVEGGVFRRTLRLFPIFTDNRKTGYQSRFVTETEFEEVFALLTGKVCTTSQSLVKGRDEFGSYFELELVTSGAVPRIPVETKQTVSNMAIALSGAVKLAEFVDKDGRFKYRYDALTGTMATGYNVLRHCGSVWAMMDVYQAFTEQDVLYQASRRATTYLLNEFLKFVPDYRYACITEGGIIKLGGNALAILDLLAVYSVSKEVILRTIAESIGASIERDRTPDGDFVHRTYVPAGKVSTFRSAYYTGEALLALLTLYEASGDERWLDIVINSEKSLMKKDYGVKEQSHWMLYALERLCRHRWKDAYARHACQITQDILTHTEYLSSNRSTAIACRSEGLLAFARLADSSAAGPEYRELRRRSIAAVKRNLGEQRRFRQDDGSFIRGGGDERNNEVRIDYIQHNISAFLHYCLLTS